MFSKRTNWQFTGNPLIAYLEKLKKEKRQIIDLTQSNPTRCGFEYLNKEILHSLSSTKNTSYDPQPFGMSDARSSVSNHYKKDGIIIDPEKIFLTASTSETYSVLLRLLTNPGDHILVPRPSYPLFEYISQLNDVTMDNYPLSYDKKWNIDFEAFEKAITSHTKAVIVVNPNNPTGSFVKKDELAHINKVCKEHNLAIISDEVFKDYKFSSERAITSFVNNSDVLTFTLQGASKSFGLPQMKVAWSIVSGPNNEVNEALKRLEIILDTYLSVNTPAQNSLKKWFSIQPTIKREIQARLEKNLRYAKDKIQKVSKCHFLEPEGGWYLIIKLPACATEEEWALTFLDKDNVFVHPGYFFDFEDEPCVILSLLTDSNEFKTGFERIIDRIRRI